RRIVREILLTGVEAHERPAPAGDVIADRAPQHRIPALERVEHAAEGRRPVELDGDLGPDARERPQVLRQHDPDHGSACTSTDTTGGRSRTIGVQLSPASADPYTCPPVV